MLWMEKMFMADGYNERPFLEEALQEFLECLGYGRVRQGHDAELVGDREALHLERRDAGRARNDGPVDLSIANGTTERCKTA